MKIKLSVIIPAYNSEEYIFDSLSSIINQLDGSVELIVINDGSTDATADVITRNFSNYIDNSQLVFLTQPNSGVSVARNKGIEVAKGEYIGFMDADDHVMPNYISTLISQLKDGDISPDIVEFGYKIFKKSYDEACFDQPRFSNSKFGFRKCRDVLKHVHAKASWYPWTRIFKKSLFNGKFFPPGVRFCEDLMIVPALYEEASTILVLDKALYGYRFSGTSATFNIRQDYFDNLVKFYESIPRKKGLRFDYLRFAIANSIYSCNMKSNVQYQMPKFITDDMKSLRLNPCLYFDMDLKKVLHLCYPSLSKLIKKTNKK